MRAVHNLIRAKHSEMVEACKATGLMPPDLIVPTLTDEEVNAWIAAMVYGSVHLMPRYAGTR